MFVGIKESFTCKSDGLDNDKWHLIIIDDNQTRWNWTYFATQYEFCLIRYIEKFYFTLLNKKMMFLAQIFLTITTPINLPLFKIS